jgi:hypothetical protein
MARSTVAVRFTADTKDLKAGVSDAEGSVSGFGDKLGGVAKVVAGAFAVDRIVDFGGQLLNTGAQLTAIDTKVKTVFEGQASSIRAWADQNNESFGVTDDQLAGLAASFGDLLKPMGFTADQAATMSKDVIGLSGALSAWSGGTKSAAEVSDILAKAMLGERDGLKELGISISEADVQARLAAKGQKDLTGAALEQAKAVATQELIFEKSADAQKAWKEGGNKALTETNKWKAGLGELKETLATKLVPAMVAGSQFITGTLIPAFGAIGKFVSDNKELFVALAVGITAALVPAFIAWAASAGAAAAATIAAAAPVIAIGVAIAALAAGVIYAYQHWDWFRGVVDKVAGFMRNVLWPALQAVAGWITGTLIPTVGNIIGKFGEWIGKAGEVASGIKGKFNEIVTFVTGLPGRISSAASGMWDGIKNAFRAAINWIINAWNDLRFPSATFSIPHVPGTDIGGDIKIGGWNLPNIPTLAAGGIVRARPGGMLVNVGEGGQDEAIVPLDGRHGLGSPTLNIENFHAGGLSADEVARAFIWQWRVAG